jgi:hypothetical protein
MCTAGNDKVKTMTDLASLLLILFAIAFGCFFLQMGKNALLSQDRFLRFCNRWQKAEAPGIPAFDLGYFGGPGNLRLLGIGSLPVAHGRRWRTRLICCLGKVSPMGDGAHP